MSGGFPVPCGTREGGPVEPGAGAADHSLSPSLTAAGRPWTGSRLHPVVAGRGGEGTTATGERARVSRETLTVPSSAV